MKLLPIHPVSSVGIFTISILVGMAEAYYFEINDDPTDIDCSNHVTISRNALSVFSCAETCAGHSMCHGFVYEPITLNCSLIRIHNFPDRRCKAWDGNDYFSLTVQACDQFLVSGPKGVNDSQLSESSNFCDVFLKSRDLPQCLPVEMRYTAARYARLDSVGYHTGAWSAYYRDQEQYIQVDFLQTKTVSAVILTGRDPDYFVQYVTRFKFLYSDDCSVFHEIVDENGTSVILEGNNDGYDIITRHLPEKIEARCFRINPITWIGRHISLRFDLLGCR